MDKPTIRVLGFRTELVRGKEVEWVKYAPASAILNSAVNARVKDLMPPEGDLRNDQRGIKGDFMRFRWAQIEPAYTAWKSGREIPIDGTPLSVWSGVTPEQADVLRGLGLRTVEDVAAVTDALVTKIKLPNARELPKLARLFLDNMEATKASEEMAQRDAKIAELEERLSAAMDLLEQNVKKKQKAA